MDQLLAAEQTPHSPRCTRAKQAQEIKMKFNCDIIRDFVDAASRRLQDAMARHREAKYDKQRAQEDWHEWYAWRPVKVARGDCRWLEVVERRCFVRYARCFFCLGLNKNKTVKYYRAVNTDE